ncbi:hypothetical protein ACIF8T_23400 [Streptomyces sp. NPDC085946]|uniref:hypothetical protein n=1 Tax=Streptomyces sp. NPDC085946 TaxID=3365744 RepID=UPI0037D76544
MTSDRSASPSGARLGRVVALTAGATLGLGVLCATPLATAGPGGVEATDTVALAADTAAPSVTLGTRNVKQGGEVSFTATGFPAGSTLSVKFDDKTLLKQFSVGDDGSVSDSVTVPVDASAGGGHWLRFLAPQTSVRSEELTVTAAAPAPTPAPTPPQTPKPTPTPTQTPKPTPTPSPSTDTDPAVKLTGGSEVAAGGKVSFTLSGFVKGQDITVKLDDGEILARWPDAVKADGTFSGTVTVPASVPAGQHWLRFLAPAPATSLKADITVVPSPGGGSGGGSTGGGGTGGSGTGGNTGGTGTAGGSSGTTGGSGSGGAATGTSATITAGSQVAAGGRVSFRVTGFPAGQRLTVKLDDSTILGQWTVGSDGSYSGSVTVPADATKGAHWLRFLAPNPPTSLKADFTVTSGTGAGGTAGGTGADAAGAPPVPAASGAPASATDDAGAKARITASQVPAGGTLHFEVTGFPTGEQVTIKLDDEAILGQWKTGSDGSYEGDVTVPADTAAGDHWLRFLAPNPPTSLKVAFTVTAAGTDGAGPPAASSTTAPETKSTEALAATSRAVPVSYATIAWSAAAAAAGGAAGATATTLLVVRRRTAGNTTPSS